MVRPRDVEQAAQDVRKAVEEATFRALEPYRLRSLVFTQPQQVAENIGELAEKCILTLPERLRVGPSHESLER